MATALPLHRVYELPWTAGAEQDRRFRLTTRNTLIGLVLLALALSFLPLPERDPAEVEEIPERFARLVIEEPPAPPPPVVEPEPEPVAEEPPVVEPTPEPEPVAVEEPPAPVIEPEPIAEPEPAAPEPAPVDEVQQARERASVSGLLPFAADLASLRENDNLDRLDRTEVGAVGASEVAAAERELITSNAGASSSGISTAGLSRNTGGSGLGGRETTQVASPVEGIGVGGAEASRSGGSSNRASRSREEIERVFDRNKGAIYALYNRALRQDPTLEGKLVLSLTIEPNGTVSACEVVSSELGDPDLESKLVQRVMLFQFEAKDVERITTTKPIDFFPA